MTAECPAGFIPPCLPTNGTLTGNRAPRYLPPSSLYLRHAITQKEGHRRQAPSWRASLLRSRAHLLGIVYAPDEKAAEAAAIAEFKIGEDMRRRLVVRPNDE
jgi:hypothetical protein